MNLSNKVAVALFVVVPSLLSAGGDKLPASKSWKGTSQVNTNPLVHIDVKTSTTGNTLTLDRIVYSEQGRVITKNSGLYALDSAGTAYGCPDGGSLEFDDVVDGSPKAYRYTRKDKAGNAYDNGVVSVPKK